MSKRSARSRLGYKKKRLDEHSGGDSGGSASNSNMMALATLGGDMPLEAFGSAFGMGGLKALDDKEMTPDVRDEWKESKQFKKRAKQLLERDLIPYDITFRVGKREEKTEDIRAHKLVLAMGSPVFREMFYENPTDTSHAVIKVGDVEPSAFRNLVTYLYSEECDLTPDNVMATLDCAKKYEVYKLARECRTYSLDVMENTVVYDCRYLVKAREIGEPRLADIAFGEVGYHAADIVMDSSFEDMNEEFLYEFLSRDDLRIEEIELYEAAKRWAINKGGGAKDGDTIRRVLGRCALLIRFPVIPPVKLADGPVKDNFFTAAEIGHVFQLYYATQKPCPPMPRRPKPRPAPVLLEVHARNGNQDMKVGTITIHVRPEWAPGAWETFRQMCENNYSFDLYYDTLQVSRRSFESQSLKDPPEENWLSELTGDDVHQDPFPGCIFLYTSPSDPTQFRIFPETKPRVDNHTGSSFVFGMLSSKTNVLQELRSFEAENQRMKKYGLIDVLYRDLTFEFSVVKCTAV